MRVYLPMTLPALGRAQAGGEFPAAEDGEVAVHAVTAAVREWYVAGDREELEFAVLTEAARACLQLLADDPDAPRRRVVVAADVPDAAVTPRSGTVRSAAGTAGPVPLSAVASVHVDEPAAEGTVAAAVASLDAAKAGDADAGFLVDEAEGCDLLWYDVSEIPHLV
jgi:hypothetical protein